MACIYNVLIGRSIWTMQYNDIVSFHRQINNCFPTATIKGLNFHVDLFRWINWVICNDCLSGNKKQFRLISMQTSHLYSSVFIKIWLFCCKKASLKALTRRIDVCKRQRLTFRSPLSKQYKLTTTAQWITISIDNTNRKVFQRRLLRLRFDSEPFLNPHSIIIR